MDSFKRRWKRIPAAVRKPLIFIIGVAIIVTGVAMLVLPGPGWAAIFLGFAVLATEFAAAAKVRDWTIKELKQWIDRLKHAWRGGTRRFKHKRK
jgi:uncharacterized protein (TIGR02611 family)